MVRYSPSPESRGPIQKWEVEEIAHAVEAWYQQGSDVEQPTKPVDRQPFTPERKSSPAQSEKQKYPDQRRPIQSEEGRAIIVAVDRFLTGNDDEASAEADLVDKIRALRIEESILKYAPHVADNLRLDAKPYWIAAEQHRLLPHDAEALSQRRWALWLYENLRTRLQIAEASGDRFTKEDIVGYHSQFQRRELPEEALASISGWERQQQPVDFTLDNLFAIAQRKLLLGYRLRGENEEQQTLYDDTLTLHNLIEQAVAPKSDEAPMGHAASPDSVSGDSVSPAGEF